MDLVLAGSDFWCSVKNIKLLFGGEGKGAGESTEDVWTGDSLTPWENRLRVDGEFFIN